MQGDFNPSLMIPYKAFRYKRGGYNAGLDGAIS